MYSFSDNKTTHFQDLCQVLGKLQVAGLTLQLSVAQNAHLEQTRSLT